MGHPESRNVQRNTEAKVSIVFAGPPFSNREPGPYDNLPIVAGPSEMDLMLSHFRQLIVELTFEVPDFGRVTANVQFDGLLTPNNAAHHFRARVFRVYHARARLDSMIVKRREGTFTGIYLFRRDNKGMVNIPDEFVEILPGYIKDNLSARDHGPLYANHTTDRLIGEDGLANRPARRYTDAYDLGQGTPGP